VSRLQVRCVFRRDSGSLTFDVPPLETSRWRAVARVLRSPMDAIGCALLPSFCSLCGSPLPHLSFAPICDLCWTEFPLLSAPACARCGDTVDRPVADAGSSAYGLCRECRMAPPDFVRAVAFGAYQGRMKECIYALKYNRLHPAARGLGKMLAEAIGQLAAEAPHEMLVIPIPLHRSKYAQRGFNQARALAQFALESLRKSHPAWRLGLASSTLMRLRATESQAGLSPRERRINLRGAFTVSDPAAVMGKHILLVDDILTTGATVRSAAKELVRAGAASVYVATLARAQRQSYKGFFAGNLNEDDENSMASHAGAAIYQGEPRERIHSSQDQPSF